MEIEMTAHTFQKGVIRLILAGLLASILAGCNSLAALMPAAATPTSKLFIALQPCTLGVTSAQ
jgi:hypothetical protein